MIKSTIKIGALVSVLALSSACNSATIGGKYDGRHADLAYKFAESYGIMIKNELFIRNMYVGDYENSGHFNHESKRDRKLLLKKIELNKINKKLKNKGLTIVPTKLFIGKNGWAKLNISIAKGKKIYDKREDLKTKDIKREIDRNLKKFK